MIRYKQAATGLEGKEALEAELNTAEAVAVNSTYVEAERNILQAEALIKEAAKHVDMQEKQRALFRRMKQEAVEAKKKDLPRRQQIWTFCADLHGGQGVQSNVCMRLPRDQTPSSSV